MESSLSCSRSVATPPKTIAPSRPFPTGSASSHSAAGCRYHSSIGFGSSASCSGRSAAAAADTAVLVSTPPAAAPPATFSTERLRTFSAGGCRGSHRRPPRPVARSRPRAPPARLLPAAGTTAASGSGRRRAVPAGRLQLLPTPRCWSVRPLRRHPRQPSALNVSRRSVLKVAGGAAAGGVLTSTAVSAAAAADRPEQLADDPNPMLLWYRQPAADGLEALAVGNGRPGAVVAGGSPCNLQH